MLDKKSKPQGLRRIILFAIPESYINSIRLWKRRLANSRTLRKLIYYGRKFYCPVCDSHVRGFRAHPSDPEMRYDALCPVCNSKSPHRRGWLFFNHYIQSSNTGLRMLHIAPEAHLTRRLSRMRRLSYFSGDILAGRGDVQFDIAQLPFRDNAFDIIYCCHVLPMIPMPDVSKAIAECYRVMRSWGVAVIENPVAPGPTIDLSVKTPYEREKRWFHSDVLRIFGEDDYWPLFRNAGFNVRSVSLDTCKPDISLQKMMLYQDNVRVLEKR
jgi:SAM-dependent methyltransferase